MTPSTDSELDPRTERTREAILQAAQDLLQSDGPDAVSHAQVAAEANVSRTTVYKHHPTRASLIRAAIEVGEPFAQTFSGDLRADLAALIGHLVDEFADDDKARMFVVFMERSLSDPELAEARDEMMCQGTDVFRQILDAGVDSGQIRAGIDPDFALAGLVGTFMYRRFMSNEPVNHDVAARVIDQFVRLYAPQ